MKLKYLLVPAIVVMMIFAFAKAPSPSKHSYPKSVDKEVQEIVEAFFKGFHAQDSTIIKEVVHPGVRMQSIGKNQTGEMILSSQDFSGFLASICSIPETTAFREEIHSYEVKMDGKMANVWTPYTFYINDAISHCGTNSFQLFKRDGVWKIFYIVDTRDREGCGIKRG